MKAKLEWELVDDSTASRIYRAKIFGGWLVMVSDEVMTPINTGYSQPEMKQGYEWRSSITFVNDPTYQWAV